MRPWILICFLALPIFCRADDDAPAASAARAAAPSARAAPSPFPPEPAWSPHPRRAAITQPAPSAVTPTDEKGPEAKFSSEAKWDIAGYNNDEVIYTIFITNDDTRILHCTVQLDGFFYEKGEKHTVSDRQGTTVFPQQRVQAGNWQGMDQKSDTTYSVKCRPT